MPTSKLAILFGAILRQRRLAAGLSQETLAELAQLHPTYIGMIERGARNPTLDSSARIAAALQVPLSSLLAEAETQIHPGRPGPRPSPSRAKPRHP